MRAARRTSLVVAASALSLLTASHAEASQPGVGSSLTLNSRIYRSTARVTLLGVIDPATPSYPSTLRPRPGDRWVVTQLRIRGVRGMWIDSPSGDGRLLDANKHAYRAFPSGDGTVEVRMPGTTDLAPGQAVQGNLVFEVPKNARLHTLTYIVQGGDTGSWRLTP